MYLVGNILLVNTNTGIIDFEREGKTEVLLLIQNGKLVKGAYVSLFIEKAAVVTINLTKAVN